MPGPWGKAVPPQLACCALLGVSFSNRPCLEYFVPNSILLGYGCSHDAIFDPNNLLGGRDVFVTELS